MSSRANHGAGEQWGSGVAPEHRHGDEQWVRPARMSAGSKSSARFGACPQRHSPHTDVTTYTWPAPAHKATAEARIEPSTGRPAHPTSQRSIPTSVDAPSPQIATPTTVSPSYADGPNPAPAPTHQAPTPTP
jgi:hypothetical protein